MSSSNLKSEMVTTVVKGTNETAVFINITFADDTEDVFDVLVTEHLLHIFRLVNYVIITGPVSVFGIIFNIMNIIVFVKIGFKETVNISLLALAVADLGSIIPLVWMSISYNPLVDSQDGMLDSQAVQVIVGWPHVCFSRITGGLTAFITVERYLCVAIPLKIKRIITSRRTISINVAIFTGTIAGVVPEYFSFELRPYVKPETNITFVGMWYRDNGREIENFVVSFATFSQLTAFITVIVSTAGLVRNLKSKSRWRLSTSQLSKDTTVLTRDRRTVQMVISISGIFIISYLPLSVSLMGMMTYKEYSIQGRYNNLLIGTATFFLCLETINSSVNIFVYYKMSSKYRAVLLTILGFKRK